jgi:hypothetical protein
MKNWSSSVLDLVRRDADALRAFPQVHPKHHAPSGIWQGLYMLLRRENFGPPPSCGKGPRHDHDPPGIPPVDSLF